MGATKQALMGADVQIEGIWGTVTSGPQYNVKFFQSLGRGVRVAIGEETSIRGGSIRMKPGVR